MKLAIVLAIIAFVACTVQASDMSDAVKTCRHYILALKIMQQKALTGDNKSMTSENIRLAGYIVKGRQAGCNEILEQIQQSRQKQSRRSRQQTKPCKSFFQRGQSVYNC